MIGEFAKDGRNRKEAKTIANKLEAAIEQHNEEKQADRNGTNLTSASHTTGTSNRKRIRRN